MHRRRGKQKMQSFAYARVCMCVSSGRELRAGAEGGKKRTAASKASWNHASVSCNFFCAPANLMARSQQITVKCTAKHKSVKRARTANEILL